GRAGADGSPALAKSPAAQRPAPVTANMPRIIMMRVPRLFAAIAGRSFLYDYETGARDGRGGEPRSGVWISSKASGGKHGEARPGPPCYPAGHDQSDPATAWIGARRRRGCRRRA